MSKNSAETSIPNSLRLLNVTEVAEILGVSRPTVYGLMNRGEISWFHIKTGSTATLRRVRLSDVIAFLERSAIPSAYEKARGVKAAARLDDPAEVDRA